MARTTTTNSIKTSISASNAPPTRAVSVAPTSRPSAAKSAPGTRGTPSTPAPGFSSSTGPKGPSAVAQSKPAPTVAAAKTGPTHDEIGRRAYEIYLDRCQRGQPGNAPSDWAQAEAELKRG